MAFGYLFFSSRATSVSLHQTAISPHSLVRCHDNHISRVGRERVQSSLFFTSSFISYLCSCLHPAPLLNYPTPQQCFSHRPSLTNFHMNISLCLLLSHKTTHHPPSNHLHTRIRVYITRKNNIGVDNQLYQCAVISNQTRSSTQSS